MPDANDYLLRNLAQEPGENLSGVGALWYALAADLLNFPATGGLVIRENLLLRPGAYWYQAVSVRRTVRYKQTPKDLGRHGTSYTQSLAGTLARHSGALAAGLEALDGQELVALYRDLNGETQLLGTPEQPLVWKDTNDSGLDYGTRNNYDWTLTGETPRRARPYLGTWQVSGVGLEGSVQLGTVPGGRVEIRDRAGKLMGVAEAGQTVVVRSGFRVAFTIL
ncbi:hypothetical protein [Hymenobacter nivis]|uniref:Uncharacterized protein n=1 Tax=Hymenobacter nivis TaxID=1850093 RepID=A0A502HB74_9BACT|nr:hypothetical protein [Hymenobacter nivis]TPG71999.1 hypothetical protein EAH73_01775 [Hymenobacter nivis]